MFTKSRIEEITKLISDSPFGKEDQGEASGSMSRIGKTLFRELYGKFIGSGDGSVGIAEGTCVGSVGGVGVRGRTIGIVGIFFIVLASSFVSLSE